MGDFARGDSVSVHASGSSSHSVCRSVYIRMSIILLTLLEDWLISGYCVICDFTHKLYNYMYTKPFYSAFLDKAHLIV